MPDCLHTAAATGVAGTGPFPQPSEGPALSPLYLRLPASGTTRQSTSVVKTPHLRVLFREPSEINNPQENCSPLRGGESGSASSLNSPQKRTGKGEAEPGLRHRLAPVMFHQPGVSLKQKSFSEEAVPPLKSPSSQEQPRQLNQGDWRRQKGK